MAKYEIKDGVPVLVHKTAPMTVDSDQATPPKPKPVRKPKTTAAPEPQAATTEEVAPDAS